MSKRITGLFLPRASIFKLLSRNRQFLEHIATLMSGKAFAGIIALATTPVVARFFSPDHFGVAALFVSTISVAATVSTLSYPSAVVLPKDDEEAIVLMALSYRVLAVVCCLMLFAIFFAHSAHLPIQTFDSIGLSKWFLPLGLLFAGGITIQEYWLTRIREFKGTSVSLVAGNASTGISRVVLGALYGSSSISLIGGYIFGQVCRLCLLWKSCGYTVFAALRFRSRDAYRYVARRYIDFPFYKMPADLVYSIGSNLPTLLLGAMFSPGVAGLFAMAKGLLQAPVKLVSNSVGRVFLQKAASIHRNGRGLWRPYWLSTIALGFTGVPVFLLIFYFGEALTIWFLGEKWGEAGEYLVTIVPWLLMVWVTVPSKAVYVVVRRQGFLLVLEIILTVSRLCSFWISYQIGAEPLRTLEMFVNVTILVNIVTVAVASIIVLREK